MLGKHEVPFGYYCGPTALMLLTGLEWPILRAEINHIRGRRESQGVTGMEMTELIKCLKVFGIEVAQAVFTSGKAQVSYYREEFTYGNWLVQTSKHFMAIVDSCVADNHRVCWTPLDRAPQRLRRLQSAWRLE